jgi:hypothetical protein
MLFNTIFKWSYLLYAPIIEFYEQASHKPQTNFYCFSAVLERPSSNFEKYVGAGAMDQWESRVYTVNKQETKLKVHEFGFWMFCFIPLCVKGCKLEDWGGVGARKFSTGGKYTKRAKNVVFFLSLF